jgi:tetratricopeptide (TPR) repeat protein
MPASRMKRSVTGRKALEIARGHDLRFTTRLLGSLSSVWIDKQDYKTAYEYANESLELAREIGDPSQMVVQLHRMARLKKVEGHFEEAIAIHEERLRIRGEIGSKLTQASVLDDIGQAELDAGRDPAGAIPKIEEALAMFEEMGSEKSLAYCWIDLARAHYLLGDSDEAVAHYNNALEVSKGIEDFLVPECHCGMAMISMDRGNLVEARGHIRKALAETWQAKDRLQTARTLVEFGRLESTEGNDELAARYLIHVDLVNTGHDLAGPEIDRGRALLKEIADGMGDAYEVFKRKVEGMSLEEVVEQALVRD